MTGLDVLGNLDHQTPQEARPLDPTFGENSFESINLVLLNQALDSEEARRELIKTGLSGTRTIRRSR